MISNDMRIIFVYCFKISAYHHHLACLLQNIYNDSGLHTVWSAEKVTEAYYNALCIILMYFEDGSAFWFLAFISYVVKW